MSLLLGNGYQHDCYVIGTSISDSFTGDFVTCVLKLRGDWIDLNIFRACEMVKRNEQSLINVILQKIWQTVFSSSHALAKSEGDQNYVSN